MNALLLIALGAILGASLNEAWHRSRQTTRYTMGARSANGDLARGGRWGE